MISYCSSGNLYQANMDRAEELRQEAEMWDDECQYQLAEIARNEAEEYEAAAKELLAKEEADAK